MIINEDFFKQCSTCKSTLPKLCFGKRNECKDGLRGQCKECYAIVTGTSRKRYTQSEKGKQTREVYLETHPWYSHWQAARLRCNNPKHHGFPYYGGRGIKMLMTPKEVEFLWNRDKASEMKKPSLDRIDSNGGYTIENCRFIEQSANSQRVDHKKNKNTNNGKTENLE